MKTQIGGEKFAEAHLFYSDLALGGTSNKEYHLRVVKAGDNALCYFVNYQNGKIGDTLTGGTLTKQPVTLAEADKIFEKKLREKLSKGYQPKDGSAPLAPTPIEKNLNGHGRTQYPIEELNEINREQAERLVKDDHYLMQVKLDGHFAQIEKLPDGKMIRYNKKGEPKEFPLEIQNELAQLAVKSFFFVGELIGRGFYPVDMLKCNGVVLAPLGYEERFRTLCKAIPVSSARVTPVATWYTTKEKQAGLASCFGNRCEGVCFKRKDAAYKSGKGLHFKFKFIKTCTCKVLEMNRKGHDNVVLGLFDGKKWREVGGASMIGKDRNIQLGSLVEIQFLYATEADQLYQPRIKPKDPIRDDVDESQCTIARQLAGKYKEGIDK